MSILIDKSRPFEPERVELRLNDNGEPRWFIYTREGIEEIGDTLIIHADNYRIGTEIELIEYEEKQ